jgi:hypothetical protein
MKRPAKFRVVNGAKPAGPSEHRIQATLVDYLHYAARPDVYYFAIPNQSNRHISNAVKMKAEGVRSGIADMCFMFPQGRVAWLEMKKPGGSLSATQKQFREVCQSLGHQWGTAKSVEEALDLLTEWDALKPAYRRNKSFFATDHLEQVLSSSQRS